MTTLNWRVASEVHLNNKIVADPSAQYDRLQQLRNVRVAIESGFLHIDPQQVGAASNGEEQDIYIVPASSVEYVKYTAPKYHVATA